MVKRGFDLTVSVISLLVLAPLIVVIALVIKRDSRGPVLYKGERIGQNGKRFRMYKFRTMVVNADRRGPAITQENDPRVTRLGRRLRRSKLDELPQLINVVRGEMSLVGPRPESPEFVEKYPPLYRRRLHVLRPGITSPASLTYLHMEEIVGSDPSRYVKDILPNKLALDLGYVLNHNFWTDLGIIGRTIGAVFGMDSVAFRWLARSIRRHVPWLLLDVPVIVIAFYAALFLRLLDFSGAEVAGYVGRMTKWVLPLTALYVIMNSLWGVHHRIWRFATAADVRPIFGATASATALAMVADIYTARTGQQRLLPLGVLLLGGFFAACGIVLARYGSQLLRGLSPRGRKDSEGTRAIIYGAGDAGQHLALRLLTHPSGETYELVGFVDDDLRKRGQRIHGLRVLGGRRELANIVERHRVDLIVIAINNVRGEDLRQILTTAQRTAAQIRIIPNVFEVVSVASTAPILREVRLEDLIGRQPIQLDRQACERILKDKVVVVTGGSGSVGSELCRQVAQFQPKHLVILDIDETGLYELELSLRASFPQLAVSIILADVTDETRIERVFRETKPDVIFHAAAYKHVPMMERFPWEAVKVNVAGTAVVLEMARRFKAQRFVLVSTDQAVEPHSVMGATKRIAEMLAIGDSRSEASTSGSTLCTAVRFGNVLGSRGSVVPTFAKQIDRGGPVTVTHPDMTRYFIDVSEVAGLIIQAAGFTHGRDIFMLEMGERIRVEDLARKMIRMRGLRPEIDIPIVHTGLRPGETSHEELAFAEEGREPTEHPLVHRLRMPPVGSSNGELRMSVEHLLEFSNNGNAQPLIDEVMKLARGSDNGRAAVGLTGVPLAAAAD